MAVIKAIISLGGIASMISDAWKKYQDAQIDSHYTKKKERRNRLLGLIQKAIEERDEVKLIELRKKLYNIDSAPAE